MSDVMTVDASGLSCPQPVLLTKRAISKAGEGTVVILVDTGASGDNCTRIAGKSGWSATAEQRPEGGYRLVLTK